ncbi:Cytochrome P450 monooxygenase AtmP [Lachnellula suecica]|uniref:Cytochrome P450 monooxygenase AtmP n=1 Tax=Lachnellula suecica TaxID=602035 RepID=A0A8T9CBL2_9HELO|nr:Cytochrome P450 monooxygenase AtmP [Lachnellula suecica]
MDFNASFVGISSSPLEPQPHIYTSLQLWLLCILTIFSGVWLKSILIPTGNAAVDAPIVGLRWAYPARIQYLTNAMGLLQEGYAKYKDQFFKINGNDMLVVPNKYVNELRAIPEERLSSMVANIENFQGNYNTIDILLRGNLHTHAIHTRLTPKLGLFVPLICDEIKWGISQEIPPCKGKTLTVVNLLVIKLTLLEQDQWVSVLGFDTVVKLVVHDFARISVEPLCRNKEWMEVQRNFPENVFRVAIQMRVIPGFLKRLSSYIMPATWAVSNNLRIAQKLIVPIVEERRQMEALGDPTYQKPNDFLQWLMDEAWNERDGQPGELVHRLLVLALASVHTTSMTATQVLYDLIAHPEYLEPLREEITQAVAQDGGWKKTTLTKMRKLDSFMKESQRLNGPSLSKFSAETESPALIMIPLKVGFKRAVMEPITLSDGVTLPKGVHLVIPVVPIALESVEPNPEMFDGFRHYRERQKPGQSNLHQFAMTDKNTMHFGHGRYSCPGRFFASHTIKILIAQLILRYDFKFLPGESRPKNLLAHEYCFPDPTARILMKERAVPQII